MIWFMIIIALILIVSHVLYENVFLSLRRRHYEFRLFALRDKLRSLEFTHGDSKNAPVFACLQSGINNMVVSSSGIDIGTLIEFRDAYRKDSKLRERVAESNKLVEQCTIEEVKSVVGDMENIFEGLLLWNSGAWFFYIVPVFIFLFLIEKINSLVKKAVLNTGNEICNVSPACL